MSILVRVQIGQRRISYGESITIDGIRILRTFISGTRLLFFHVLCASFFRDHSDYWHILSEALVVDIHASFLRRIRQLYLDNNRCQGDVCPL